MSREDVVQITRRHDPATPRPTRIRRALRAPFLEYRPAVGGKCYRLLLGAALALCLQALFFPVPASPDNSRLTDGFVVSNSGRYVVEYRTHPSPIPVNDMFTMTVTVREPLKRLPARHIKLRVDAGMSEHNHGMNTMPVVERLANGQFTVRGMLFHMAGKWELAFSIKRGILSDKAEQVIHVQP